MDASAPEYVLQARKRDDKSPRRVAINWNNRLDNGVISELFDATVASSRLPSCRSNPPSASANPFLAGRVCCRFSNHYTIMSCFVISYCFRYYALIFALCNWMKLKSLNNDGSFPLVKVRTFMLESTFSLFKLSHMLYNFALIWKNI